MHRPARRSLGHLALEAFFESASRLGRLSPSARPHVHGVEVLPDIAYRPGDEPRHRLDVYRPVARSGPLPVLIYMHGGGFAMLSKNTHWLMALLFARAGFLVFNVGYRLAPLHRFPAALEDVCDAYTFIAEHAAEYGGDLGQLVVAGESAGANLACGLTVAACYPRPEPYAQRVFRTGVVPRAVIAACGLLQVSDPARFARRRTLPSWIARAQRDITAAYLGALREGAELADPLLVLESAVEPVRALPAFFSFAGTRDPILDDTRRLHAALSQKGVTSEVRYYPGELHAFHAFVMLPAARACWRHQLSFLRRELGSVHSAGTGTA